MNSMFVKPLTKEQLEEQQKFIDDYNKNERALGNVPENPLTGEVLRQIVRDKKQEALVKPSGPK